jgi:formylglycine-generating enzyme required for sulfatase activity
MQPDRSEEDPPRTRAKPVEPSPEGTMPLARDEATQPPSGVPTKPQSMERAGRSSTSGSAVQIGAVLGPYEIVEKLGQGGMGAVFKAKHAKLKKIVALKVLTPAAIGDPAAVARFEREMEAVGKITHPNIVQAFDAGEVDGVHYLAMEYVEGTDVSKLVKQRGPLKVSDACKIIRQAAQGLAVAHAAGLIHRDVKPANMLLSKDGRLKLLDLGLARLTDSEHSGHELTETGQAFGTPDYMAPEQWRDTHNAFPQTDLYALGCTLHYLLTGRPPYSTDRAKGVMAKMHAHVMDEIPPLVATRGEVPATVVQIYRQLLAKDPASRIQSATELARMLTPLATDAPSGAAASGIEKAAANDRAVETTSFPFVPTIAPGQTMAPLPERKVAKGKKGPPIWIVGAMLVGGAGMMAAILGIVFVLTSQTRETSRSKTKGAANRAVAMKANAAGASGKNDPPPATKKSWHGWPVEAPDPAIAPFTADRARKYQEEWAAYLKVPVEFTNSVGIKFTLIPPGEFTMGSTEKEIQEASVAAGNDQYWKGFVQSEKPRHHVVLTQPFYLSVHEVTQGAYETVLEANPSHFSPKGKGSGPISGLDTSNHPVEMVSWNDAAEFCAELSSRENLKPFYHRDGEIVSPLDGTGYRLPSEAQWEFACRAGTLTPFSTGDSEPGLLRAAHFGRNSERRTHAVGELLANPFGLFDIHGNVWEWVEDAWEPEFYARLENQPAIDPKSEGSEKSLRGIRGGYWSYHASHCRSGGRFASDPLEGNHYLGFRLASAVEAAKVDRP